MPDTYSPTFTGDSFNREVGSRTFRSGPEPNLDKRTAALLSSLTDRRFLVVEGGSLTHYSRSMAICAGENPTAHKIRHSIHIHITPTNAAPPVRPERLQETIDRLPIHLDQYRQSNLDYVRHWTWIPPDLPSETMAIATAFGRGIVNTPYLRRKLPALLKAQGREQLSQRSGTTEALVVEATLVLSRQERERVFTSEIAAEANRLLELRGERQKLSPETVGRRLRNLGLRPHHLTNAGNGLTFDKATVTEIQRLAAMYVEEDLLSETENLPRPQTAENKKVEEVV
jgi:hypothetical protein